MKHSMLWTIPLIAVLAFLPLPAVKAAGQDDQHASHHGGWRDDDDKDWHDRDNDKAPVSVTVSFGAGLNTAMGPPNEANDHILPKRIEVKAGGVVNFVVAGFHQIFAYVPGVKPQDILDAAPDFGPPAIPVTPDNLYINYGLRPGQDSSILFYVGLNPGGLVGGPPPNPLPPPPPPPAMGPVPVLFTNFFNRVESIVFPEPGRYLVICNVNPHFRAGMMAWVKVSK
jgi:plastocyanin